MNEVNERRFPTLRPFDYLIGMQLITDLILLRLQYFEYNTTLRIRSRCLFTKGGMHEITNSLVKLAKEIELNFILIKKLLPLKQKKTW
jgi:hypothetical protein